MADEAKQAVAELVAAVAALTEANNLLVAENRQLRAMLERVAGNTPVGLSARTAAPRGRG